MLGIDVTCVVGFISKILFVLIVLITTEIATVLVKIIDETLQKSTE